MQSMCDKLEISDHKIKRYSANKGTQDFMKPT